MSDTPETDAEQFAVNPHGLDGGREMTYSDCFTNEQLHHALAKAVAERDEAREEARRATYDAAQETIKVSTVKSHWIEACRERDEAREAFAIATSNCVDAQQRLREMEDQRDFAMSEMERLKR